MPLVCLQSAFAFGLPLPSVCLCLQSAPAFSLPLPSVCLQSAPAFGLPSVSPCLQSAFSLPPPSVGLQSTPAFSLPLPSVSHSLLLHSLCFSISPSLRHNRSTRTLALVVPSLRHKHTVDCFYMILQWCLGGSAMNTTHQLI